MIPFVLLLLLAGINTPGPLYTTIEKHFPDLKALEKDPRLEAYAQKMAQEMISTGILSHVDKNGGHAKDRLAALKYPAGKVGEILGAAGTPQKLVQAWIESPSHKKVLETKSWKRWGAAMISWEKTLVSVVVFWGP